MANGNGMVQRWAIGIMGGIILGGGSTAIYGTAQRAALEKRLDERIDKVELSLDSDYGVTMEMAERLVRIETRMESQTKQLDEIKEQIREISR